MPRIKRIRGKLFPDRYLLIMTGLLISVAFVVLCLFGFLWVAGVSHEFSKKKQILLLLAVKLEFSTSKYNVFPSSVNPLVQIILL